MGARSAATTPFWVKGRERATDEGMAVEEERKGYGGDHGKTSNEKD